MEKPGVSSIVQMMILSTQSTPMTSTPADRSQNTLSSGALPEKVNYYKVLARDSRESVSFGTVSGGTFPY